MTALNFWLTEERVIIVADSLATGEDRSPQSYVTKILPLPHLDSAICSTGRMELLLDLFRKIQTEVIARDVVYIASIAPSELRSFWTTYEPDGVSATIYLFGSHPTERRMCGFAFRSKNGFVADRLPYGVGVKPASAITQAIVENAEPFGIETWAEIMEQQRLEDEARPLADRVGIGGEIHLLSLQPNYQAMWTCYRFEDHDAMFGDILRKAVVHSRR